MEVFEANALRLPSIAVFVPSEEQVAPVCQVLASKLEAQNIPVEASHHGRILGNQAKVRVFNVEFIKGLEFEAVFFVGIDQLANTAPELVDRYLYVALTRARSFVAVTCETAFPEQLKHVQAMFKDGDWKRFAEPA